MQALVIGPETKDQAKSLIAFAADNVITFDRMMKMANGVEKPIGDDQRFAMDIPVNYRVVYTHEMHKQVLAKHISISYRFGAKEEKFPSLHAVNEILELFGFAKLNSDQHVYKDTEVAAINILERVM